MTKEYAHQIAKSSPSFVENDGYFETTTEMTTQRGWMPGSSCPLETPQRFYIH